MPPRYAYWTIIAGGLPTAFRAAERDELLPTFRRIQEKHPDAEMKYFARGRLWDSQEQARQAAERRRDRPGEQSLRGRDWRPGGEHRDPRQKFRDAKKARNLRWRRERFERRLHNGDRAEEERSPFDRDRRPRFDREERAGRDKPPAGKAHGDPLRDEVKPRFKPKPFGKPQPHARGESDKRPWSGNRNSRSFGDRKPGAGAGRFSGGKAAGKKFGGRSPGGGKPGARAADRRSGRPPGKPRGGRG